MVVTEDMPKYKPLSDKKALSGSKKLTCPLDLTDPELVRAIFLDTRALFFDEVHSSSKGAIKNYLSNTDFSDAELEITQACPSSVNPTYLVRMKIPQARVSASPVTLTAYVKLYGEVDKRTRDAEVVIGNYIYSRLGISTAAAEGDLRRIDVEIEGKKLYALVAPFVSMSTLHEHISENKDRISAVLREAGEMLSKLHDSYFNGLELIIESNPVLKAQLASSLVGHDYDSMIARYIPAGSALESVYKNCGINRLLTESMHRNPSLVHGDAHPRNIGLDAMENYVLFDFERTGIGAPQFDEARLYAHRDFSISLEEQVKLAKDSAKRRNISDIEGYIAGYHAAVIFKTIEYMSYIYGLAGEKGIENSKAILDKNLEVVRENANALLSEKQASELVAAAKEAFNLDNVFPIKPASVTLSHTSDINMHSYEPKAAEEKPVYALSR